MSRKAHTVRAAATRDLLAHAEWLRDRAGPDVAERYVAAAQASFARLAEAPGLGPATDLRATRLKAVRKWRVDGFPNYLIFYLQQPHGVTIIRVLHAAQDWAAALDP